MSAVAATAQVDENPEFWREDLASVQADLETILSTLKDRRGDKRDRQLRKCARRQTMRAHAISTYLVSRTNLTWSFQFAHP